DLVGAEIHVKHENYQPTGAFKVRGGINLIGSMPEQEKAHGVITASTGNHGQSIAYACRLFGVRAVIGVPDNCNPSKLAAMKSWKQKRLVTTGSADTFAEGVQTRVAFEMTQQILWENLKQFVLVEEDEMRQAILQYLEKARVLAEGAGAAPLAAANKCAQQILGKKVVL